MTGAKPLSEIAERLQTLAMSKHDDSLFTGSEFVDAYGESGQPLDSEPNRTIATAGGNMQNAYSKVFSVYTTAKNTNEANQSEFKITGDAEHSLNTDVLVADLRIAVEQLDSAVEKLSTHDVSIAGEVSELREHVNAHRERITSTGMVVLE